MEVFTRTLSVTKIPKNDFAKAKNIKSDYANWVIPGRLMCGPTPGPTTYFPIVEATDYHNNMNNILADGIDTFVCLQQELHPESYKCLVKSPHNITYLHFPIKDEDVPPKQTLLNHITQILELLNQGKNIYIHCAGGHGRTSLYVACILACLYKEMRHFDSLMYYVQSMHDLRRKQKMQFYGILPCIVCGSSIQREMIKEFLSMLSFVC